MVRSHDLTPEEVAALVVLEQGARSVDEFAELVWPHCERQAVFAGAVEEGVAKGRDARALLLSLARKGLATNNGTTWQVTVPGRRLALRQEPTPARMLR